MTMPRDEAVRTIEHAATVLAGDGEPTIAANLIAARTTLTAHIAQQDATIARMRKALKTCLDYGNMTDDGWVTDKARAALEAK